jgi:pimeloyl-ACP methyl ester carboxylesterase
MTDDQPSPLTYMLNERSDIAIIAFGSLRLKEAVPPFEWGPTLKDLEINKIQVRDLNKIWYLRGLPGISQTPLETRDYLHSFLQQHHIHHVMTIGGSMGGYAALLYGALLEVDEVHAFAGQTFLPSRRGRIFWKTVYARNWAVLRKQAELLLDSHLDRAYYDLRAPIRDASARGTDFSLYYSDDSAMDVQHARHVTDIPGVKLHSRTSGGHHISKVMRDSGELAIVLNDALARLGHKRAMAAPYTEA